MIRQPSARYFSEFTVEGRPEQRGPDLTYPGRLVPEAL
jgi:hypothetical protein